MSTSLTQLFCALQLGANTAALFLSLRYHLLHPDYVSVRIKVRPVAIYDNLCIAIIQPPIHLERHHPRLTFRHSDA